MIAESVVDIMVYSIRGYCIGSRRQFLHQFRQRPKSTFRRTSRPSVYWLLIISLFKISPDLDLSPCPPWPRSGLVRPASQGPDLFRARMMIVGRDHHMA